jgi:hypothetical protein
MATKPKRTGYNATRNDRAAEKASRNALDCADKVEPSVTSRKQHELTKNWMEMKEWINRAHRKNTDNLRGVYVPENWED